VPIADPALLRDGQGQALTERSGSGGFRRPERRWWRNICDDPKWAERTVRYHGKL